MTASHSLQARPTALTIVDGDHSFSRLEVGLGDRAYPIEVGQGLIHQPGRYSDVVARRQVMIVTNPTVAALALEPVRASILRAGARSVHEVIIPDGEAYKDLDHWGKILSAMLEAQLDRKCVVVALGGGVIGDMAGFAAAAYQRGVAVLQIPTTLLSMVDSSVGGKTAVNHPLGKNMIGAFHQPSKVLMDLDLLKTLPERELSAGLAEIIKYGCILDDEFFHWLEVEIPRLMAREVEALAHAVLISCAIKAQVVAADEKESSGLRALLNFGHTFGHAIEAGLGFGTWLHGEAVGCGMVMAGSLSARLGQLSPDQLDRLRRLVQRAGLPVAPPGWPAADWLGWMAHDKKADSGSIRYILLRGLGASELRPVESDEVAAAIQEAQSWGQEHASTSRG